MRTHIEASYRDPMRAGWRWGVCAAVVAVLVALPFVVRYAPVPVPDAAPAALLARIQASAGRPYAGYAESTGSLALPTTDQLNDVATLLSGRMQVRVWWQSPTDWRTDTITPAGERSTRTTTAGSLVWDYEDNRVTTSSPEPNGTIRLPRDTDTLPPQLAARMLSDARPDEVTALPGRRVAGRPAEGLSLRPNDPLSSVGRVDVWADEASGIPVLVEVFGRTGEVAAMASTFLDFTDAVPTDDDLGFVVPPGVRVRPAPRTDLVRDVARSVGPLPPGALLGFSRSGPNRGVTAIGQYGRGVTQLVVGALPDRIAGSLREQLRLGTGARETPDGVVVGVGPVGLLLTTSRRGFAWLVAGTVTPDGLARAATELSEGTS
jgi:outer membrane lipoprotein-sorting protein